MWWIAVALISLAAAVRAELTWHLGGPIGTMLARDITAIEADGGKLYIGTSGVRSDPCQIILYTPATLSRRTVYTSSAGQNCRIVSLRKRGVYMYAIEQRESERVLLRFMLPDGAVEQLFRITIPFPSDMIVEDGTVLMIGDWGDVVRYRLPDGAAENVARMTAPWCVPTRGDSFYAPRSIDVAREGYFVSSLACGLTLEVARDWKSATHIAGVPWQNHALGNITPGQTSATTITAPSTAVRAIAGGKLAIGAGPYGFIVVDPATRVVLEAVTPGRPTQHYDPWAFGMYLADAGDIVWAAGQRALVAWQNRFAPTPTPRPRPSDTPRPTHTATVAATPTATLTSPTATASPVSRACALARELVREVCE